MKVNENMETFNFLDALLSTFAVFAMRMYICLNIKKGEAGAWTESLRGSANNQEAQLQAGAGARLAVLDGPERQRNEKLNYDAFDTFLNVTFGTGTTAPAIFCSLDSGYFRFERFESFQ